MPSTTTDPNTIKEDIEEYEIDIDALEFTTARVNEEADRLKKLGLKPIVLKAKNYGILIQDEIIINRIEIDTGFDFESRITQILVSDRIEYPLKSDFSYIHLILLTEKPEQMRMPLLVPYIFPNSILSNDVEFVNHLKEWLLINAKGYRARHSIQEFHDM
jgi:hypothetical protein